MYLVAIAWMYVVVMMSVAEATSAGGTVLGAVLTFVLYGVLPLSIVLYLMGTPARRQSRRRAAARNATESDPPTEPPSDAAPDGGHHPAGDTVATIREEP